MHIQRGCMHRIGGAKIYLRYGAEFQIPLRVFIYPRLPVCLVVDWLSLQRKRTTP
jgi:hypothetical protein